MAKEAVEDYLSNPHSPEVVTSIFQTLWQTRQAQLQEAGADVSFTIPPCSYTEEELKVLESEGRRVGYLPKELATQESRHLLAVLWPQMRSYSVQEGNSVTNEVNRSGWFDYEAAIDALYRNTTEDQLRKELKKQKREGLTLNQYIVAGQDSKLFTGKYLDEVSTRVRLLGSRRGGSVVDAHFGSDGDLYVDRVLDPRLRNSRLGGRSSGAPKVA